MATRSRIGIELKDGSVLSVYHHWDGYPEWLGRILRTHFNDRSKVAELIDGGDMSSAWTNCGWNNETRPTTCPLYYSERGQDCPPVLSSNLQEYLCDGEEYAYLFRNGEWVCYNRNQFEFEEDGITQKRPEIVEIPSGALMA
jgi:hypothetical protein